MLVKVEPMLKIVGDWQDFLSAGISDTERDILRRHMRTGRPLGSESFIGALEKELGCKLRPLKPGPTRSKNACRKR
jgi:putative transposase